MSDNQTPTLIHARVQQARHAENPMVICQMPSRWAVLGDSQFLPGYCLLLPDPGVPDLNTLDPDARRQFLYDMTLIGDALLEQTEAFRINYEILGNTDPALHAYIFPRYLSEPEERRRMPVFLYPKEERTSRLFNAERDRELSRKLAEAIERRL